MPGGDRSGPGGLGPRTGRALGYCTGHDAPGFASGPGGGFGGGRGQGYGRGGGRGRAGGRGWRHWYHATGLTGWQRAAAWGDPRSWQGARPGLEATGGQPGPSREDEVAALRDEAAGLRAALARIEQRLARLGDEGPQRPGRD